MIKKVVLKACSIIVLIIGVLLGTCFMACSSTDTTQEAKDEFSQYSTDDSVVLILDYDKLCFDSHTIDMQSLISEGIVDAGYVLKTDKVYFGVTTQRKKSNYAFLIYECDHYGGSLNVIFEKDGYRTRPSVRTTGNTFYIQHYTPNELIWSKTIIDSYNLVTEEYRNVDSGKNCSIFDYVGSKDYSYEITGKCFKITDNKTLKTNIVDEELLNSSICAGSLNKYKYGPRRMDVSNGHILLSYGIGAGNSNNFSYLIFEYDFERHQLYYKSLVFTYDTEPVDIQYLVE